MDKPEETAALTDWLDAIAAPTAAPAGGAAAALAGAMGAALIEMVAGLTVARERYAAVHEIAGGVGERARTLRTTMQSLAARDAAAFEAFTRALALPKDTAEERTRRTLARADAFRAGAAVQLELLAVLAEGAELGVAIARHGLAGAVGDAATAVFLAGGASRSAAWAVRSNLREAGGGAAGGAAGGGAAGGGAAGGGADAGDTGQLAEAIALLTRVEDAERQVQRLLVQRVDGPGG